MGRGDAEIALKRLDILDGVPLVELNQAVRGLAVQFLSRSNLPPKASEDLCIRERSHRLHHLAGNKGEQRLTLTLQFAFSKHHQQVRGGVG